MGEKKTRLQFDVTADTLKTLDELRELSGVTTRAELFRRALKLYGWVLEQQEQGKKVIVKDGDEQIEIAMF